MVNVLRHSWLVVITRCNQVQIWGLDLVEHRKSFTCVQQEHYLLVQAFKVHLIKHFCEVFRMHQISVRDFEEILATMPIPVHENARFWVGLHSLGHGVVRFEATSQNVHDGLTFHVVRLEIDLDFVAHPVKLMVVLCVKRAWENIARVACVISRDHEQDVVIMDAFIL